MKVPLLDLKAQFAGIEDEVRAAIDRVLASQHFILGPDVEKLESEIAKYVGADRGVGVASGSDAILLSLMALGVGQDDAVITTPYSFFSTAGSITRLGAIPLFVDIEPDTFNIDPRKLDELLSGLKGRGDNLKTANGNEVKAIMPVHLYGQVARMSAIMELSERFELPVVEDAAQAIGATLDGKMAGSIGTLGCFSFFPSKNLGGFGDGGMIMTSSEDLVDKIKMLRNHGSRPKYYHKLVGVNSRLDALQAAVLLVKLGYLDEWSESRRRNADRYRELFNKAKLTSPDGPIVLSEEATGCHHVYNQFIIRVESRDKLKGYLNKKEIGTEIYYPLPLHLQECYSGLGYSEGDFPVAEEAAETSLALPIYPELTHDMQKYVVDSIRDFYRGEN